MTSGSTTKAVAGGAPCTPADRALAALVDAGLGELAGLPGWSQADPQSVGELLGAFAELVGEQIAPLSRRGDLQGSRLDTASGRVRTPEGFADAYRRYVAGGWPAVAFPESHGGGGMPWMVGTALADILNSADLSFALCPMLTASAVELFSTWGTPDQQARYLGKLISGEWTGTMNLTEPDAGSDVGALRTMAHPDGEGWRLSGTKVFITWGDHDMADNVVHLVLARTPGAPPGTRGLSLFAVPARLVDHEGRLGAANAVRCVALEHKLGIHASPTCVMEYDGAVGELVGELHGGMRAMFTMMNTARLSVGVEGVAVAERALQAAAAYAAVRRQGRLPGDPADRSVPIAAHPDVARMLATMRALVDAARLLVYSAAHSLDLSRRHPDPQRRAEAAELTAFLVPLAKAWPTDVVNEVASLAVQVHGGAGYVEETGVAQTLRDARITAIYEGTNGIQAIDLVQRKLDLQPDSAAMALLGRVEQTAEALHKGGAHDEAAALADAAAAWRRAAELLVDRRQHAPLDALAGATPFLTLTATMVAGWLLARSAVDAADGGPLQVDPVTRFFLTQRLPQATALVPAIVATAAELTW